MENYKICNLVLKKKYKISNYYEFYYKLLLDNNQVKQTKNSLIFNKFKVNIKVFVNGIVTITGMFVKNLKDTINDFIIEKNSEKVIVNKDFLKNYKGLYIYQIKNIEFLLNKEFEFIGIKSDEKIFINNIQVNQITDDLFMSCDKNKTKTLFKNGKVYGSLNYNLFKSKKFFNNSTVNIDYNSKLIFSNDKIIGSIIITKNSFEEKEEKTIDNDFTIVSCNIQFSLNIKINRFKLFNNLIKNNYTSEYKLFDYSAVNFYYDNVVASIFNSGNVIVKGLSNNSSITNIENYINKIYNIIISNV